MIAPPEMPMWWMSWWLPGEDCRPLTWPPPEAVLGFWDSGGRDGEGGDEVSVVAMVRADTEDAAWAIVSSAGMWPDMVERRFCRVRRADETPSTRFPPPKWSVDRGTWPWVAK